MSLSTLSTHLRNTDTELMGGYICNLLACNYIHTPSREHYLASALTRVEDSPVDKYTILYHAVRVSEGEELKRAAVLAVENFPQVDLFWKILSATTTITRKLWDRYCTCKKRWFHGFLLNNHIDVHTL